LLNVQLLGEAEKLNVQQRPQVTIHEVGPRDGLQNQPEIVSSDAKVELVTRLADAGARRIEVTSFVSPEWIPQLADGDDVARRVPRREGVRYSALVPNMRGYERFRRAALAGAAFFVSASESHNRKNVNRSIREHLDRFRPVAARARGDGVWLRAYVSTVCGCPYQGKVAVAAVVALVRDLLDLGVDEGSLGDTIGVGTPDQVQALVGEVARVAPLEKLALHMHDTYGRALANVHAGYASGIRIFDSSLGGLGGCPYAPGASGNVATEDVVDLFEASGVATGMDLEALVETAAWVERDLLKRSLPGRVLRARLAAKERGEPPAAGGP
jgi:hydroxymethylglutaryl-CoA lyase